MSDQHEILGRKERTQKTWAECGIEEKVERLRHELLSQRWNTRAAYEMAGTLQQLEHNAKGEIVVPLHRSGGGTVAGQAASDPLA